MILDCGCRRREWQPRHLARPRGFALKFYTTDGNYDMVGNNTPIFFLRDPMKFQHFIRSQKRRADHDDYGQARTQVREVLDDDARERLVSNVAGHLSDGVTDKVLARAFEYWKNVDQELGDRIEQGVGATVGA